MENYDNWNEIKKKVNKKKSVYTKQGEIYYASWGYNIGYEQNGKGVNFMRPILVYKKFGQDTILAMPLSSKSKTGRFYFPFIFQKDKTSIVLISQIRLIDTKRLYSKEGRMKAKDLESLKKKFYELLN